MNPQDLATIADGARLAGFLPYLTHELEALQESCITRAETLLSNGQLTPERSQMAWIELLAYRRLMRRLDQKVKVGVAVGQRTSKLMDLPEPAQL